MLGAGGPERLRGLGTVEVGVVPQHVQRGRNIDWHVGTAEDDAKGVLASGFRHGDQVLPAPRLECGLHRHAVVVDNGEEATQISRVPRLKAVEFEDAVLHREVQRAVRAVHILDATRSGQVAEVRQDILLHPPVHLLPLGQGREHGELHELLLALADEAADGKADTAESIGLHVQVDLDATAVGGNGRNGSVDGGVEGCAVEGRGHGWRSCVGNRTAVARPAGIAQSCRYITQETSWLTNFLSATFMNSRAVAA
jgi:hypothetical protein